MDIISMPIEEVIRLRNDSLNIFELDEKRTRLQRACAKEYETRGNTKRCQDLCRHYEAVKEEMDRR